MNKKRLLLLSVFLVSVFVPVLVADVIYYYQGQITVGNVAPPMYFAIQPNGNAKIGNNFNVPSYINAQPSSGGSGFTAQVNITNATYNYYFNFMGLAVSKTGYIYLAKVAYSYTATNNPIQNATLYIMNQQGQIVYKYKLIVNGVVNSTLPSTPLQINSGSYIVSLLIVPYQGTLPKTPSNDLATITVNFGFSPMTASPPPIPLPSP
ncbi:hypothetical protein [Sulfolobus acidocaldarius]|uniref:Uncharacterized protein n=1 Tax=Sulfolobus acidocaldarius TaxID=2285 RepID=A0A0U3F7W2_9CREN|nr:hypothetical protein [Sulfolobus acidocaldarius]ALU29226.1 hypothetical protein ATY89_04260 [Sulfolobus acidocaldarius]